MRVKFLHMKQLTALKRATSSRSFSILSSHSWWEMCSSGNRTRSVRPGGNYRSIDTKISELPTGIFGWMERALDINAEVLKTCCWCSSPSCNRSWSVLPFRFFFLGTEIFLATISQLKVAKRRLFEKVSFNGALNNKLNRLKSAKTLSK